MTQSMLLPILSLFTLSVAVGIGIFLRYRAGKAKEEGKTSSIGTYRERETPDDFRDRQTNTASPGE